MTAPADPPHHEPEPDTRIDAVPHDVVGYLAMGLVGVAMAMFIGYVASGVGLALILGPVVGVFAIARLSRLARRERHEADEPDAATADPDDPN